MTWWLNACDIRGRKCPLDFLDVLFWWLPIHGLWSCDWLNWEASLRVCSISYPGWELEWKLRPPQVPPVLLFIHLRDVVHPSCNVDPCNTVVFPTETVKAFYDIWRLQYLAVEPWSSHFHYLCLSFSVWLDNRSSKIIVKMGSSLSINY